MTHTRIRCLLPLLLVGLLTGTALGGLFDDRYPSPRALAMGGAGAATPAGLWSAYYNPAGLSALQRAELGTAYARLYNLGFLHNYFGGGAYPLSSRWGSLAATFQYFGVDYEGENLTGEYTMTLSHGFYLLKDIESSLSLGYSIKAYHLNYGTSVEGRELGSTTTFGVDVGLQASVYSRTTVGIYVLNFNNPSVGEFTKYDLPQRIVAGVAYQPYDGVTTTFDLNRVAGGDDLEFWGGAEFRLFQYLELRFGATTNPNRFTAGVGVNVANYRIDYGMRTHSELGETHSIGFVYGF